MVTIHFTVDQILAHILGDYIIQSSWMANSKVSKPGRRLRSALACAIHVLTYGVVFLYCFKTSLLALLIIVGTHFLIDHFRLAVFFCWAKNLLDPGHAPWAEAKENFGFSKGTPSYISFWIMVLVDNFCHILINALALAI